MHHLSKIRMMEIQKISFLNLSGFFYFQINSLILLLDIESLLKTNYEEEKLFVELD